MRQPLSVSAVLVIWFGVIEGVLIKRSMVATALGFTLAALAACLSRRAR